jgi:hypothetical protein
MHCRHYRVQIGISLDADQKTARGRRLHLPQLNLRRGHKRYFVNTTDRFRTPVRVLPDKNICRRAAIGHTGKIFECMVAHPAECRYAYNFKDIVFCTLPTPIEDLAPPGQKAWYLLK